MRMNLPVTHQCYEVPEGTTLMSTTDLKGRITYANPAFVAACGIEREALLGQPHNVVRHPDMPPAAFADMWRTLKAGDSWTALVKNRRANGDFYWVRANAAPVSRQGQVVGYLSVRTRAQPADVQAADDLYRRLRDGQAGALRFHKGLAVHGGWRAPLSLARTLPLAWRLAAGVALAAVGGVGAAAAAGVAGAALAATAAGMAAAAAAGWVLLQAQVARPLAQVLHEAQRVAAGGGDGQARLDRVDEIGLLMRAVNQAGLNLRALVDDVGEQVAGVRSASHEIAAGARDLSARTEGAAGHLEETAASMEQLHGTVNHSADHAQQASRLAAQASSAAAGGSQVVDGVVGTMDGITRSARRIGDIVGVIDGIAFQTNLLALNAAVEAARAGEQGRGFAVVAGEVRALASRSADAAREIKGLIETSVNQVQAGSQRVTEAGQAMQGIVHQVRQVDTLIGEISRAALEQAAGVGQVNSAVAQLDDVTQQNAALVEQSAAAATRLADQAARLAEAVQVFRQAAVA
jgi:aerotaxis receptor